MYFYDGIDKIVYFLLLCVMCECPYVKVLIETRQFINNIKYKENILNNYKQTKVNFVGEENKDKRTDIEWIYLEIYCSWHKITITSIQLNLY